MSSPNIDQVRGLLEKAIETLKEAVDTSVVIRANQPADVKILNGLWESFLDALLGYVKKRGQETRQNLFAGVRFPRLF